MANFTYNWQNGAVTSIPLSSQTGFDWGGSPKCSSVAAPDNNMMAASNEIILHAADGIDPQNPNDSVGLHDVELYCAAAQPVLDSIYQASLQIRDQWDTLEIECANWNNWFRWCKDKGIYCYMSENDLEDAYYKWVPVVATNLSNKGNIMSIWQDASNQIALNGEQATDQAILDQLIAETNQLISIAAYNNEERELAVASKKTEQIFLPVILGLLILGIVFFMLKK